MGKARGRAKKKTNKGLDRVPQCHVPFSAYKIDSHNSH